MCSSPILRDRHVQKSNWQLYACSRLQQCFPTFENPAPPPAFSYIFFQVPPPPPRNFPTVDILYVYFFKWRATNHCNIYFFCLSKNQYFPPSEQYCSHWECMFQRLFKKYIIWFPGLNPTFSQSEPQNTIIPLFWFQKKKEKRISLCLSSDSSSKEESKIPFFTLDLIYPLNNGLHFGCGLTFYNTSFWVLEEVVDRQVP